VNTPALYDDSLLASARGLRLPSFALVITVVLALVLQWVIARIYSDLIVEIFNGARSVHAGGLEVPVSYLITAVTSAATALYCERHAGPSRVVLVLHLIAVIIPLQSLVVAQFEFARPEFSDAVALSFLAAVVLAGNTPKLSMPQPGLVARLILVLFCVLLTCYVYAALLVHGGLGRMSFDLAKVYEVREEFLEGLAPFAGYLVPWQGLVLNPALMLAALKRRSLLLGLLGLALQTLLFGMTGFRAFLLMPGLLLGMYMIGGRRQLAGLALAGMMFLVGVALALYVWLDAPAIPALLVDRIIIIPAEIHYWYYDFFGVNGNAPLQLSQSVFAQLATVHYQTPIAEVIAWKYMGLAAWANVGLFADAFANFGFAGCAVFALLFALVLKTLDAASRATDARVAAALVAVQAFQLVNAGLLTTLLTHGLGIAILILWAFPMPRERSAR
jgi:hypothetical protein